MNPYQLMQVPILTKAFVHHTKERERDDDDDDNGFSRLWFKRVCVRRFGLESR